MNKTKKEWNFDHFEISSGTYFKLNKWDIE